MEVGESPQPAQSWAHQAECQTEGDDNWSSIARLEYTSSDDVLVLAKAKMFGIHTDMYEIPVRELNGGNIDGIRFAFYWARDALKAVSRQTTQVSGMAVRRHRSQHQTHNR